MTEMLTEKVVVDAIIGVCPSLKGRVLPPDSPFQDLGLDSLDIFNLLLEVERVTGESVPDDKVMELNTINRLLEYHSH